MRLGRDFIVMLSVVMLNVVVPLWSDCLQLNNKAQPSKWRVFANGARSFSQLAISSNCHALTCQLFQLVIIRYFVNLQIFPRAILPTCHLVN